MELDRLALHPVRFVARLGQPLEAALHRNRQEKRDVRAWESGGPRRRHALGAALVGESRVVIAVGDHDLAGGECWGDNLRDQLPARGHEEIHLGLRIQLHGAVKDDLANTLAQLVPTRLAHEHRLTARQRTAQQLDLRGLSRPFGPFERDEQSALHPMGSSGVGEMRSRR